MNSVQALYQKITDPIDAAHKVGIWLARSGMLGSNITAEAGAVIALDAFARGIPITEIPLNYYLVGGRITMKAEAMLAGFHDLGGKHRIIQQTPAACEIELSIDSETEIFVTTWEQAKAEKWPYGKDGKSLKDNWKTEIARADMLWARTISRGVRKLRPGVVGGKYTPEEIQDLPEYAESIRGNGSANGNGEMKIPAEVEAIINGSPALPPKPIKPIAETVAAKPVASADGSDNDAQKAASGTPQASSDGFATGEQTERIRMLFGALAIPHDAQQSILAKRNVKALRSLTFDQAAELLTNLEAKYESQPSLKTDAACTGSQVEAINRVVAELTEDDPKFAETFTARLAALGKKHVGELTIREADAVLSSLTIDEMSSFFERSLTQLVSDHANLKTADPAPPEFAPA